MLSQAQYGIIKQVMFEQFLASGPPGDEDWLDYANTAANEMMDKIESALGG